MKLPKVIVLRRNEVITGVYNVSEFLASLDKHGRLRFTRLLARFYDAKALHASSGTDEPSKFYDWMNQACNQPDTEWGKLLAKRSLSIKVETPPKLEVLVTPAEFINLCPEVENADYLNFLELLKEAESSDLLVLEGLGVYTFLSVVVATHLVTLLPPDDIGATHRHTYHGEMMVQSDGQLRFLVLGGYKDHLPMHGTALFRLMCSLNWGRTGSFLATIQAQKDIVTSTETAWKKGEGTDVSIDNKTFKLVKRFQPTLDSMQKIIKIMSAQLSAD